MEKSVSESSSDIVLDKQSWRTEVTRAVTEARVRNLPLAVIFIDINNFKDINDTLGHIAGDEVISQMRELLIANLRHSKNRLETERDILKINEARNPQGYKQAIDLPVEIGHIGGDEFGILCKTDKAGANLIIERLRNAFRKFMDQQAEELRNLDITLAIGVSVLQPGMNSTQLLEAADQDMYSDKLRQLPQLSEEQEKLIIYLQEELERQNIRLRDLGKYILLLSRKSQI